MRKLLIGSALAVVASALPVSAQVAEPVPTEPCAPVEGATVIGLDGRVEEFSSPLIPAFGHDLPTLAGQPGPYPEHSTQVFNYLIDLSGSETAPYATKGSVNMSLTWDNDLDYDMYVYDADGDLVDMAEAGTPTPTPEVAMLSSVAHCSTFRIDVVNYSGPPTTSLTLTTAIPARRLK